MPSLRSLSQLRVLLPYAAKLLPVLTGVSSGSSSSTTLVRPDLSSLTQHFGEIQTESRSLRSQLEGQGVQIVRIQEQLDRLTAHSDRAMREQEELATSFQSLASLLKGLFFVILFLLVAVTVMCGLILVRITHL